MGIRINGMAENDPLFEIRDRAVVITAAKVKLRTKETH
jgi:hypothetical protein